ncbi:MAG: hypothetical protein IPH72_20255 [Sandaracinaceae bacterium]|nr:hypothetical protein [Sandaracinaceae bacterium]
MSWETVTSLPQSHSSGSPYQGQAEPVVRRAVAAFRSSAPPELPPGPPGAVVLTPNHLYGSV